MNVVFKNPGCNGWIIVDKDQIVADTPRNYHVAEVSITSNWDGSKRVVLNAKQETCCGLKVKSGCTYMCSYLASEVSALRMKLAEMENSNNETCGNCIGHFYADPVA